MTAHLEPLSKNDKNYNGSRYIVLVNWDSCKSTYETLNIIVADDPVTCVIYGMKNNLLHKKGWKRACKKTEETQMTSQSSKASIIPFSKSL